MLRSVELCRYNSDNESESLAYYLTIKPFLLTFVDRHLANRILIGFCENVKFEAPKGAPSLSSNAGYEAYV